MRTALLIAAFLAVSMLLLPGCQMNERLSGTAMGGVAGAAIGGLAGGWGGAVIGGAGGALAGYLIGDYVADGRERGRSTVFTSEVDPNYQAPRSASGPQATYARTAPPTYVQPQPQQTYGYPSMVAGLKVSPARQAYERGRKARTAAEARRHYQASLRLDPRQPDVHNALGLHALLDGNKPGAQQHFRTALRYDPGNYAARKNLQRMGITASR